jgi:zinc transport system permease protein
VTDALGYPFFQRALLAGLAASVACGVMGTYVVVRRMASISGGLSHAAFGGVGIAYFLGWNPTLGATGFALLCGLGMGWARLRLRSATMDTLIAVMWAAGMAVGILFVSLTPGYAPDLMSYLFGSILFVPTGYLVFAGALDLVILGAVAVFYKEFQAVSFDEEWCAVRGVPVAAVFLVLVSLVSLAVVSLIQVVGAILVIALLTIPAAVARQWVDSMGRMMVVASVLGALLTVAGLFLSYALSAEAAIDVPTGPLIILLAVLVYGASSLVRRAAPRA